MSERLYKTQAGSYYTIWNDSSQDKPQKSEGLKTKNKREARSRLHTLEMLYNAGYHKPFDTVWHKNKRIKHYVYSGDLTKIDLAKGNIFTRITYDEALQEYAIFKVERREWTAKTRRSKMSLLKNFDYDGMISELTEDDLHAYLIDRNDSYRFFFMQAMRAFLNWCESKQYVDQKPIYKVSKPTQKIPLLVTNDVLKEACYKMIETRTMWKAYGWLVLRLTGMRPIELISLKTKHVDLDSNRILVGADFKTKTNRQRFVDINETLRPVIEVLIKAKNEFILNRSGQYNSESMYDTFKELTGIKMYALKDTFGYWTITKKGNRDFNLIYLRDQFGHTSLESTEKYLKFAPKQQEIEQLHNFSWLEELLNKTEHLILNE